jgi:hypothetical protein
VAWVHTDTDGDRNRSAVTVMFDLRSGALLGGPYPLPAQAHEIAFSPDGRRLLAWNVLELSLRDGTNLAPVPGPLALFRPRGTDEDSFKAFLRTARFDAAQGVEMAFAEPGDKGFQWELRTYAADGGMHARPLSSVAPKEILPLRSGAGTVVAGEYGGMSIVATDASGQDLPDFPDESRRYCFVASPDGRWLARARRDGAALFDLHGGARVATLRVALPRPDLVWQLAFSPDGNRLLARTLRGRLMVWDLSPDMRAPGAIARELELRELNVFGAGARLESPDPSAAERLALRATDPGPPPVRAAPAPMETVRDLPGGGIPPRGGDAPADALDLTPWYTFGLREPLATLENGGAEFRWLPQGVQRLLGVDYDIRGGVGLHAPLQARFDLRRPVAAIDVLVLGDSNMNGVGKDHIADARVAFADGSEATLPIGFVRDSYYAFRNPAKPAPALFAAWGFDARTLVNSGWHDIAFVARVRNPHPERPIATLTLSAPGNPGVQAAILAVSLEPTSPATALPSTPTGAN